MDTSNSPSGSILIAGFAVLAVVATAGTVLALGGGVEELVYAFGAGIVAGAVVVGSYALGSRRGQPHSHAVGTAAIAFGVLFLIAMVYRLLTQFGA